MARVFVSHASKDAALAAEVHHWLIDDGHEAFLDQDLSDGILAGEEWEKQLRDRPGIGARVQPTPPDRSRTSPSTTSTALVAGGTTPGRHPRSRRRRTVGEPAGPRGRAHRSICGRRDAAWAPEPPTRAKIHRRPTIRADPSRSRQDRP